MAQLTACDNCEKTTKDDRLWWRLGLDDDYCLAEFGWPDPPYQFCSWRCVAEYAAKRDKANTDDLPSKPGEVIGNSGPPWPFSKIPPFRKE